MYLVIIVLSGNKYSYLNNKVYIYISVFNVKYIRVTYRSFVVGV